MTSPLESIYAWRRPHRTRAPDKKMKVLCLGLSRSGTDSLKNALLQLGYDHVYHGFDVPANPGDSELWHRLGYRKYCSPDGDVEITTDDFDQILARCEAVTDMPAATFATELIKAYPDAKVILNTRKDMDRWYESHLETFSWGPSIWLASWFAAEVYWLSKCHDIPFEAFYWGSFRATGKWRYREHVAMVKGLMAARPEDLLEWTVQDGWAPLCTFLGKPVPDTEFPSGNAPKEMLERTGKILDDMKRTALRGMIVTGAVLVGGLSAAAWYALR